MTGWHRWTAREHSGGSSAPRHVHADEYDHTANKLLYPENLAEEDDPRRDPRDGDHVLVNQDPVGPDTVDAPLPGREVEGGGEDRLVGVMSQEVCKKASR